MKCKLSPLLHFSLLQSASLPGSLSVVVQRSTEAQRALLLLGSQPRQVAGTGETGGCSRCPLGLWGPNNRSLVLSQPCARSHPGHCPAPGPCPVPIPIPTDARWRRSQGWRLCLAGSLIQVPMSEKGKITRGRLGSLSLRKEGERQCFLFSKHLIICTRGSGGKLHLTKVGAGGRRGGLGLQHTLACLQPPAGTGRSHSFHVAGWLSAVCELSHVQRREAASSRQRKVPCSRSPDSLFIEKLKLQPRLLHSTRSLLRSLPKTQVSVGGSFAVN